MVTTPSSQVASKSSTELVLNPLPQKNFKIANKVAVVRHSKLLVPKSNNCSKNDCATSKYIALLQCNIGGYPQARLAKGSVLRKLIDSHDPTFILLTETKRKRKDIPLLPEYGLFSLDPLEASSGGIAFYYKKHLSFRTSIVSISSHNSIIWIHLSHHEVSSKDIYICGVYAPTAMNSENKKYLFIKI